MNQDLEPYLRMAISNIRNSAEYIRRIPGTSQAKTAAINDMEKAIKHIQTLAEKKKITLRESMKT